MHIPNIHQPPARKHPEPPARKPHDPVYDPPKDYQAMRERHIDQALKAFDAATSDVDHLKRQLHDAWSAFNNLVHNQPPAHTRPHCPHCDR